VRSAETSLNTTIGVGRGGMYYYYMYYFGEAVKTMIPERVLTSIVGLMFGIKL
jgi:hypothetical protein